MKIRRDGALYICEYVGRLKAALKKTMPPKKFRGLTSFIIHVEPYDKFDKDTYFEPQLVTAHFKDRSVISCPLTDVKLYLQEGTLSNYYHTVYVDVLKGKTKIREIMKLTTDLEDIASEISRNSQLVSNMTRIQDT